MSNDSTDNTAPKEELSDRICKQNKKKTKERRKRVKTVAEAEYRKKLFISIVLLLVVIVITVLAGIGAVSFYLLKQIIADPSRGYTIRKAIVDIRKTPGISEKWRIAERAFEDVSGEDGEAKTSGKSGGGKFRAIRERSEAAEEAANSGVE